MAAASDPGEIWNCSLLEQPILEKFQRQLWRVLSGVSSQTVDPLDGPGFLSWHLLHMPDYATQMARMVAGDLNMPAGICHPAALCALLVLAFKELLVAVPAVHNPELLLPALASARRYAAPVRRARRWLPLEHQAALNRWPLRLALKRLGELSRLLLRGPAWAPMLSPRLVRFAHDMGAIRFGFSVFLPVPPSPVRLVWEPHVRKNPMEINVSDKEKERAFTDAVQTLTALGQDWFPAGGSLIALLRYGELHGHLADGKVDVVDTDLDFNVRVEGQRHWLRTVGRLTRMMLALGWSDCQLLYRWGAPLGGSLKCTIEEPFDFALDFEPYVVGKGEGLLYEARICQNATRGLWPPVRWTAGGLLPPARRRHVEAVRAGTEKIQAVGCGRVPPEVAAWRRRWSRRCTYVGGKSLWYGALPRHVVYPLRSCLAYGSAVPCPRESVRYLHGMSYGRCLALPVVTGDRNPMDERNRRLMDEGLTGNDLAVLWDRAKRLHSQGYQSFYHEFQSLNDKAEACEIAEKLDKWGYFAETKWAGGARVTVKPTR